MGLLTQPDKARPHACVAGAPVDLLTGFLSEEGNAYSRPGGVALGKQGALLVADDVGNVVWRVSALQR